jgi:hypothetical protein
MVVQRAREFFGDRLDDVLHMVREDRNQLRGWQEPAHIRATVRRTIREEGSSTDTSSVQVMDYSFTDQTTSSPFLALGQAAGEPDGGQQREAIGRILESGGNALEKVIRNNTDLNIEETFGLEVTLLLYGRPSLVVNQDRLASVPPFWNLLEDQREDIEMVQRGVGRIELLGHPEFDWAGTGFLVTENFLLTTRRTAELFAEFTSNTWQFRPGISAWMDYRSAYQNVSTAGYRVRNVFGVHETYDLALLEVEPPQLNGNAPTPLPLLGDTQVSNNVNFFQNRQVYVVGYPIRDARRNEPELIARIFRDVYNVKRVSPGQLRGEFRFSNIPFLRHDAAPLGITSGAPIIDLETHLVVGVQLSARYLETGTAVPTYALRDDPLFRRANIPFTTGTRRQETDRTIDQIERLSRTRFWNEARTMIEQLYQRAFGR